MKYCVWISFTALFAGCIFSAGTHGSIKRYSYPVKKEVLQSAINQIINTNTDIQSLKRDRDNFMLDVSEKKIDTVYFKDDLSYEELVICNYQYTIHYSGDEESWKQDTISEISIAYAFDEKGNGGSEGNGDFPWYRYSLKKKLLRVFEINFVTKIDSILQVTHGRLTGSETCN